MPVNANIYRIRNGNETLIASGVSTPYDASGDDIQESDDIVVELANGAQRTTVEIAPSISNYSVTNPSGQDVQVSFDSDEQLGSNAGDIDVAISGAESASLARGDFTESGTGPYTYTATYAGSTDGDYTATLNTAQDPRGNDGASGQSGTVSIDTTAPTWDVNISASTGLTGQIDVTGDYPPESDLSGVRFYRSTTQGFTPDSNNLLTTITSPTPDASFTITDDGSLQLSQPQDGTTYYYKAEADDDSNNTATSNEASGSSADVSKLRFTVDPTDTSNADTASGDFRLPLYSGGTYNFTVDWGDGNSDTITAHDDAAATHTYSTPTNQPFEIQIEGTIEGFNFNNDTEDNSKLLDVKEWGPLVMLDGLRAFRDCTNMTISATDAPDLTNVTRLKEAFRNTGLGQTDFSPWDTSNVTDMNRMFQESTFDGNFGGSWTFANVQELSLAFFNSDFTGANATPNNWDVSSVTNDVNTVNAAFVDTFKSSLFDADIADWDITGVKDPANATSSGTFEGFLNNTGYSTANYDALLQGWSNLADNNPTAFPNNATLDVDASYTGGGSAATARDNLINNYGWTINDNGTA